MSSSLHHLHNIQSKGYSVLRNIIPKEMIIDLRNHVRKGVRNRPQAFLEIANPSDVLNKEVKQEDPRMTDLKRKFAAHKQKRKKLQKQKKMAKLRAAGKIPKSNLVDEDDEFHSKTAAQATASDITRLSQRITQQLAQLDPSDSRIQNDPQRLKAIDEHRCNLWMTEASTIGKEFIHSEFGKMIGRLCSEELSSSSSSSSFKKPTLFADRPLFQLPYGRPTMMHFAAPFFGLEQVRGSIEQELMMRENTHKNMIESNTNNMNMSISMNAICLWIPLEDPLAPTEENLKGIAAVSSHRSNEANGVGGGGGMKLSRRKMRLLEEERMRKLEEMKKTKNSSGSSDGGAKSTSSETITTTVATPIRVLENSHRLVRSKMLQDPKRYDLRLFRDDFNAVDSAISIWMRRFPELMQQHQTLSDNNDDDHMIVKAVEIPDLHPGSVVAFDPFTFAGLGPNVTTQPQSVLQLLIMNNDSDDGGVKPSIHPYSWIREWKSTSLSVDFSNGIVFPKLYK